MIPTSRQLACRASLEAFINCYLLEVNPGEWHDVGIFHHRHPSWSGRGPFVLELALPEHRLQLALDVSYRSQAGRHSINGVSSRATEQDWQTMDETEALLLLTREMTRAQSIDRVSERSLCNELELAVRILQSSQLTSQFIDLRRNDESVAGERFIDSEQSLLYGHWLHPTPKSRQGVADWQQATFAPECRGRFQLHYFAAHRSSVVQDSAITRPAESLISEILSTSVPSASIPLTSGPAHTELRLAEARDEILLPAHPLQAAWLLERDYVREAIRAGTLRSVGAVGPAFTPTSSVRTVYNEHCNWMLKLSVPVKITNSLRANQPHELRAGVMMARLLQRLTKDPALSKLGVLTDPAYASVAFPGVERTGFETIVRHNPFLVGNELGVHSVAALVAEPMPHLRSRLHTLIEGLALAAGRSISDVAREWFERYCDCALEPLVELYDSLGIALEAHQQNSLLDVSAGYPRRYTFRDNQGYYLSRTHRARLLELEPRLECCPELFYDDELIRRRFSYYLLSNQLFSVIWRLGTDGLVDETTSLAIVRARLTRLHQRLRGVGRPLLERWLDHARLPYKANLLTRLSDVDELRATLEQAVYTEVDNPLVTSASAVRCVPDAGGSRDVA